jgi:hypothetical protein
MTRARSSGEDGVVETLAAKVGYRLDEGQN